MGVKKSRRYFVSRKLAIEMNMNIMHSILTNRLFIRLSSISILLESKFKVTRWENGNIKKCNAKMEIGITLTKIESYLQISIASRFTNTNNTTSSFHPRHYLYFYTNIYFR